MNTRQDIKDFLERLDKVQFLSPNEPITPYGIDRVLSQMREATSDLEGAISQAGKSITMWNPNLKYQKGDIVLYFKQEKVKKSPDMEKREFVFLLVSTKKDNTSIPNYDMVNHVPDFTKSGWSLINPTSYLLQDLDELKEVVKQVFSQLLTEHVESEHGLIGASEIDKNLLRKDYSNLITPWGVGNFSLTTKTSEVKESGHKGKMKLASNGIMEYQLQYSFEDTANPQYLKIEDDMHYYQKSPIWDESDNTIFSRKYMEDNMMSVIVNPDNPIRYNGLRYGTNIFHRKIEFDTPFINDQYMVFFDTYGNGQFVFGYDRNNLRDQTEPTYDAIVSMPMLMNKTEKGFDIVLPIHCHFNSLQKYNIGVPWNNMFTLQAIGRYR